MSVLPSVWYKYAENVGSFSAPMYRQLLDSLFCSARARGAALSTFMSKYCGFADCRFFLLKWIASQSASMLQPQQDAQARGVAHMSVSQHDIVLVAID